MDSSVIIGTTAERVAEADAWQHVAGVTIGQDLSERVVTAQRRRPVLLGKWSGSGPRGPGS